MTSPLESQPSPPPPPKTQELLIAIWLEPRATIRSLLDNDPTRHVLVLAMISGVFQTLDRAASRSLGDTAPLSIILAVAFFAGPFFGILSLYIGGALFRWSGSVLGGTAEARAVRTVLAWGSVPDVINLFLFLPVIAFFGHSWFTTAGQFTPLQETLFLPVVLILAVPGIVLTIWKAVILCNGLGEAHGFSAWRGLGAFILGFGIIILPIFCVVVLVGR